MNDELAFQMTQSIKFLLSIMLFSGGRGGAAIQRGSQPPHS
jgi:hypothetical protein